MHLGPAVSALMMWLARKLADIQRYIEIYTTYTLSFLYLDSPSAGFILFSENHCNAVFLNSFEPRHIFYFRKLQNSQGAQTPNRNVKKVFVIKYEIQFNLQFTYTVWNLGLFS